MTCGEQDAPLTWLGTEGLHKPSRCREDGLALTGHEFSWWWASDSDRGPPPAPHRAPHLAGLPQGPACSTSSLVSHPAVCNRGSRFLNVRAQTHVYTRAFGPVSLEKPHIQRQQAHTLLKLTRNTPERAHLPKATPWEPHERTAMALHCRSVPARQLKNTRYLKLKQDASGKERVQEKASREINCNIKNCRMQ